ncbi:hypothetical protein HPB47_021827 [Ixodes persulcatus]|uniref:Uncharacterized protein n=1 Tax=Ixodes persulcatus TaxID=34615 RepID=A0AC60QEV5_IXOPE|nr:hypothetical protein HPB47_021827 [Ixodes persulcatus]
MPEAIEIGGTTAEQGDTGEGPDPTSMDLMARVAKLCHTVAQCLVLAVPALLYTGNDDRKSVADFLAELPRGFGDNGNAVDGRKPSTGPSYDVQRKDYHHGGPSGSQFSSPKNGYNDGCGAPTNGHQDCYECPPERDVASYGLGGALSSSGGRPAPKDLLMVYCALQPTLHVGNVVKTKFLKNKNGCVIAQTEDHLAKE